MKIEVVQGDTLKRKLWVFDTASPVSYREVSLRLSSYHEQTRKTTRHMWRGAFWNQIDERRYRSELPRPTKIPASVYEEARYQYAKIASNAAIYIGWVNDECLYDEGGK